MDKEFWLERWQKNEIGFHLSSPHHYLQRFFGELQTKPGDTLFVPLCGKSPDLIWLAEQGLKVVGVELSRTAVEDFFRENHLPEGWTEDSDLPWCATESLKIFCGDFFRLSSGDLSGICAVYDRGSLVALPPEMRSRYAEQLAALLPSGSRILLVSYQYNQAESCGPPFSVTESDIALLFAKDFQIKVLAEEEVLRAHRGMAARGVTRLTEFAVLLTRN